MTDLVDKLRTTAVCIYVAAEKVVADDVSLTCKEAADEIERLRPAMWLPICDYVRAKHGAHVMGWNEKVGVTEFLLHDDGWTVATFNGQLWRGSPEKFMPLPSAPTE